MEFADLIALIADGGPRPTADRPGAGDDARTRSTRLRAALWMRGAVDTALGRTCRPGLVRRREQDAAGTAGSTRPGAPRCGSCSAGPRWSGSPRSDPSSGWGSPRERQPLRRSAAASTGPAISSIRVTSAGSRWRRHDAATSAGSRSSRCRPAPGPGPGGAVDPAISARLSPRWPPGPGRRTGLRTAAIPPVASSWCDTTTACGARSRSASISAFRTDQNTPICSASLSDPGLRAHSDWTSSAVVDLGARPAARSRSGPGCQPIRR